MESNKKNMSDFIDGLKSSNISSNISSLNFSSEQIELLLTEILKNNNKNIINVNLKKSLEIISRTNNNNSTTELLNYYIKFGDTFKSMVTDLKKTDDLPYAKKIAIEYLDIAKQTKDSRVKNLAFAIADELSE